MAGAKIGDGKNFEVKVKTISRKPLLKGAVFSQIDGRLFDGMVGVSHIDKRGGEGYHGLALKR
ncbi:MAG: hypothetical protein SPI19_01275 [Peptoniphilaceae bacterium]|nr:hypothetical protein [Peptoniphilaceae bacterium]